MMRRAALVALAAGALFAASLGAAAQTAKIPKVGIILPTTPAAGGPFLDAFRAELRERGYVDAQSIALEPRGADGKPEHLREVAAELVRLKVDVIVARTGAAAVASRTASAIIPIVLAGAINPVRLGLAASLERPERNVTGVIATGENLWRKQLEVVREILPDVTRVAVLMNPADPSARLWLTDIGEAARSLGMRPGLYAARTADELDGAFASMAKEGPGALLVPADALTVRHRARIADLALKAQLPAIYGAREFAEAGGLIACYANETELYRRSAVYVDKILKGARPANLPIDQVPSTFDLVINLKTAKALSLTLPPPLLQRATEVIQ